MVSIKKLSTWLFCFSYMFLLLFSFMGHVPGVGGYLKKLTHFSIVILIVIFLLQLLRNRIYQTRELFVIIILLGFSLILAIRTEYYGLFKLMLVIATTRQLDFDKCIRFDLLLRIVFTIILYFLYLYGIAPDVTSIYNGIVRHSFGFQNCNHVGLDVFILILELFYLNRKRFRLLVYILSGVLLIYCDLTSRSRTAELFIVFAMGLFAIHYWKPELFRKKLLKSIYTWAAPFFAIITLLILYLYKSGNKYTLRMDVLFSGRIANISYYSDLFGVSLFGNSLASGNRTLDSFYAYLWLSLGLIAFVLYMAAYVRMITYMYEKNNIPMVIILFLFAAYGLSERLWMSIDYNMFMLAFREVIYHDICDYELEPQRES